MARSQDINVEMEDEGPPTLVETSHVDTSMDALTGPLIEMNLVKVPITIVTGRSI